MNPILTAKLNPKNASKKARPTNIKIPKVNKPNPIAPEEKDSRKFGLNQFNLLALAFTLVTIFHTSVVVWALKAVAKIIPPANKTGIATVTENTYKTESPVKPPYNRIFGIQPKLNGLRALTLNTSQFYKNF